MNRLHIALAVAMELAVTHGSVEAYGICKDMDTPRRVEVCWAYRLSSAQAKLDEYVSACKSSLSNQPDALDLFVKAQDAWNANYIAHCQAVMKHHPSSDSRGSIQLECFARLTRERTQDLWRFYLQGTPSDLPDPSSQHLAYWGAE